MENLADSRQLAALLSGSTHTRMQKIWKSIAEKQEKNQSQCPQPKTEHSLINYSYRTKEAFEYWNRKYAYKFCFCLYFSCVWRTVIEIIFNPNRNDLEVGQNQDGELGCFLHVCLDLTIKRTSYWVFSKAGLHSIHEQIKFRHI